MIEKMRHLAMACGEVSLAKALLAWILVQRSDHFKKVNKKHAFATKRSLRANDVVIATRAALNPAKFVLADEIDRDGDAEDEREYSEDDEASPGESDVSCIISYAYYTQLTRCRLRQSQHGNLQPERDAHWILSSTGICISTRSLRK